MTDEVIILNNAGNNTYAQVAREWLTSPVRADMLRILLSTPDQLNNVLKIRNSTSTGGGSNRDISIGNYVNAKNKSNLIIEVPLDPPVILNGQTYFQTDIEPNSEINLMFYFDQVEIGNFLE
jgi:hypothetical protein